MPWYALWVVNNINTAHNPHPHPTPLSHISLPSPRGPLSDNLILFKQCCPPPSTIFNLPSSVLFFSYPLFFSPLARHLPFISSITIQPDLASLGLAYHHLGSFLVVCRVWAWFYDLEYTPSLFLNLLRCSLSLSHSHSVTPQSRCLETTAHFSRPDHPLFFLVPY